MSIDINWATITSGLDGEALAETIRSFVHEKFQQVTLPGFIRSVEVHSFDFGKTCPQLEIKDIGDPLPEFYDDEVDSDGEGGADVQQPTSATDIDQEAGISRHGQEEPSLEYTDSREDEISAASLHGVSHSRAFPPRLNVSLPPMRSPFNLANQLGSPFPRSGTPVIPGGTSNLSYFHLPVGGLSGTQTPLAAVASGWSDPAQGHEHYNATHSHTEYDSNLSTRPSTATSLAIPQSLVPNDDLPPAASSNLHSSTHVPHLPNTQKEPGSNAASAATDRRPSTAPAVQQLPSDLQIITRVKYAGDIRLTLTAEILLDYPMPSFVGIPLKLSITGLTFDGVAILASIKKNLHFCFLAPEDAEMLVGRSDEGADDAAAPPVAIAPHDDMVEKQKGIGRRKEKVGGLLEEIRVESEIGRKESGKQVLKNVGKVERFVLEQVRRIFEDEFVFPSFWTFLV